MQVEHDSCEEGWVDGEDRLLWVWVVSAALFLVQKFDFGVVGRCLTEKFSR